MDRAEKFKSYTDYSWKDNAKWQTYLNNLYPMPSLKLLEKRKRKWYRDNIDKDFDINYDPEEERKQNNDQQQRQGPPPGANPYAYAYQQAAQEAMPQLRLFVGVAYFLF